MKDKAKEIRESYPHLRYLPSYQEQSIEKAMLEFARLMCEEQIKFILNNCKITGDWGFEVKDVLGKEKVKNCKNVCDL